jgi:lipoprotein-releasing system permease protein
MFVSTFIAIKYIQSKKYKFLPSLSFLTSFLGIFLSVFTLIATVSVMEGFKQEFQKTIIGIRPHLKVYFPKVYYGRPETFSDYKQKSIQLAGKEILHSGGGISGEAMVSHNSKISGILFSGLEAEDFLARNILKSSIISGNLEGFNTSEKVIIGSEIAFLLGVKVGDKINLISPNFRETAFGAIPIHKTFTVGGIFKVGMHFYDSSYIFLPAKQAENFLGQKGVNFLEILVKDPNNLKPAISEIRKTFGDSIFISDWKSENASFINAINLQKSVMFFILLMFLILASFIVFSGLSALVNQKNKTTAILRTIGFSPKQVVLTFLQVGLFTSIPALILGVSLGSLFVIKLEAIKNWLEQTLNTKIFDGAHYFLSYIPSKVEISTIIQISIIGFLLCFISVLIPSIKALKTKPIESLRWE